MLNKFQSISGLKINLEKTKLLKLGSAKDIQGTLAPELNLEWTNEPISILGVQITTKTKELVKLNFEPKVKKFKQILNIWQSRDLTIMGKIQIIKSLALPQFTYLASILPGP